MQPPSSTRKGTNFSGRFSTSSSEVGNAAVTLTNSLETTEPLNIALFGKGGVILPLACGVTAIAWYGATASDGTKGRLIGDDASTTGISCASSAQAVPIPASAENWKVLYAVLTGAASVACEWCLKD